MAWSWGNFGDYVSADEKRQRAASAARQIEKKEGRKLSPVQPAGRLVAESFWGKAWCRNLESYSDYASRLPRGRSYLRQGAVLDLRMNRGAIHALVSGTRLYEIEIKIDTLANSVWTRLKKECAGKVGSLMDLLQGKLSGPVMEIVTRKDTGLFPKPREIRLECSCPDWADLCKHVAATLYGVGACLDQQPELLFTLRGVDHLELIASATDAVTNDLAVPAAGGADTLDESSLTEIFGIEIAGLAAPAAAARQIRRAAKPASATAKGAKPRTPAPKPSASRTASRKTTTTKAAKPVQATRKRKTPAKRSAKKSGSTRKNKK